MSVKRIELEKEHRGNEPNSIEVQHQNRYFSQ